MTKQEEIKQLKAEQDAVILAHYYVDPQVQELADYIGDSFYLSKVAAGLENRTLVFCGVSFMGESGKLLSPDKVVLMPDAQADCPMAHMVTKEEVEQYRKEYPGLAVVCYINSTAEIKSWSDVCVTSANAVQIVRNLPNQDILFIPDKNLGRYVASQVPEKHVMLVKGCCPVHDQMSPKEVSGLKKIHPNALVLAHPECNARCLSWLIISVPPPGFSNMLPAAPPGNSLSAQKLACVMSWNSRIRTNSFIFLIQNQSAGI